MSFLDGNNSEYLSARLTRKGRMAIANGDFKISYFAIGDSEFVYTTPFSAITGDPIDGTNHQGVFAPFDKDSQIKYPLKYDTNGSIYGIPVTGTTIETLRNAMGPAGFVSAYDVDNHEATVVCLNNTVSFSQISGGTILYVDIISGTTYSGSEFITLSFDGMNGDTITGNTNSQIYKLVSVSGITSYIELLTLDRPLPNLTGLTGNVHVISNKCDIEFPPGDVDMTCLPILPETTAQHNPWTLNVVWSQKPIGFDTGGTDENLSGFTSSKYISTKDFLGYQTTGQTHTSTTGTILTKPTSYINSSDEEIEVLPTEQKSIALVHYSEIGDIVNDPDRFFKYDDYISMLSGTTITPDESFDYAYFQIYLPYLQYHRNTGTTIGAIFKASDGDKEIRSVVNESHKLTYRDLLDENDIKVGKIFTDKKIIVFDDEEIVAALDYKSNRTYTLPAPKVGSIPTDTSGANSVMEGTTGQTLWVTYMFTKTGDKQLNGLPCNYFTKITGTTTPSNVTVKFERGFQFMRTTIDDVKTGFVADKFYILTQMVDNGELPTPSNWDYIDFTSDIPNHTTGIIDPENLTGVTFTINKSKYDSGSGFDIEQFMYDVPNELSTDPQFGDEQPFPGSIKLVRASDIHEMNFLVNLPNTTFMTSQKQNAPANPMITEIALLNDSKDTMVMAKTAKPIKRIGTQVFAVKLDF